jgi:hypothetical protein
LKLDYTPPPLIDPGGRNPPVTVVIAMPAFVAESPWTIDFGASWEVTSSIRIQSSLEYQHWSSISNSYSNPFQFHVGAIYTLSSSLSARLGFFTQSDPSVSDFGQDFLTGGFRISVDQLSLSVALLDSHLFGNSDNNVIYGSGVPQFHQTIVQGGLAYTF